MSVLGATPFAVILCKLADHPEEPQTPDFQAFFTPEDRPRKWGQPFRISDPNFAHFGVPVAVVARYPNHLDVFWIGNDGAIWSNWWDANFNNGLWNDPFPITDPGVAPSGGGVAAVARYPDHLDVYWADNGGAIGTNWWDAKSNNGLWNTPFRITDVNVVPAGGGVAAVARYPDHLDVYWADNGGAIGTNWWDANSNNGLWNTPFRITDVNVVPAGGGVAAVARYPDHLDVYWADNGGAIGTNWWDANSNNGLWNTPFRITDVNVVPAGGGVAAVARYPDHLDVYWADNGGAIGTNWWDANSNNGLWNTPFRITDVNVVPAGGGVAAVARYPDHLDVYWADNGGAIGTNYWPSTAPQGLAAYWRDMSYGEVSWDGTTVFGWKTLQQTSAELMPLSRDQKIAACMAAHTEVHSHFYGFIAIVNSVLDSGAGSGTNTILDPLAWNLTFAAHETGHNYGLDHSFDDSGMIYDKNSDDRPGAYGDSWDIMSARNFGNQDPTFQGAFSQSGPGLNAPYRDKLGWIPSNRINNLFAGNSFNGSITLAALDHPEANGYLMVKLLMNTNDQSQYYTVEFRRKDGWDQAIPQDTVLIHQVKSPLSYLIRADGGPQRLPGQGFVDPTGKLSITVQNIDPVSSTAIIDVVLN